MTSSDNIVFRDLSSKESSQNLAGDRHQTVCKKKRGTHHNTSNRAQKHGIGREVRRKAVTALQEVPWEHAKADNSRDISTSSDVLLHTDEEEEKT